MDHFSFFPSRRRTAAIDLDLRRALGDSVATIADRASRIGVPFGGDVAAWRGLLLAHSAQPPQLWACYRALVEAVARADGEAIASTFAELLATRPGPSANPGSVLTISEGDLGAVQAARYVAIIDGDSTQPLELQPAPAAEVRRVAGLVGEARALLREACPVLLDEIDTLGHQIVLATSGGARRFGGAASVFLWGAVVLNPALVPDRVTLVEALAHETAHALLFGMTLGADLTTNGTSERFSSPLRADARPMEGIVHAVYVLARMNHALDRLRGSTRLDAAERVLLERKHAQNAAHYRAGLATIEAHARFTREGAIIFGACRAAVANPLARDAPLQPAEAIATTW